MNTVGKESASKSNDDDAHILNDDDMLTNMNTSDKEDDNVSVCANCGKKGDDVNNTCNKSRM